MTSASRRFIAASRVKFTVGERTFSDLHVHRIAIFMQNQKPPVMLKLALKA